jgi:hypothetical protein
VAARQGLYLNRVGVELAEEISRLTSLGTREEAEGSKAPWAARVDLKVGRSRPRTDCRPLGQPGRVYMRADRGGLEESKEETVDLHIPRRHTSRRMRMGTQTSRHGRRVGRFGAVAVGAVGLALWSAGAASAAPTIEHVHIVANTFNGPDSIIGTGVFDAGGTFYSSHHNSGEAVFDNGTFLIHHKQSQQLFKLNPKTCEAQLYSTGTFTLDRGVGAYVGMKGSGTYKASAVATFPRNANGTCDVAGSVEPTAFQELIVASGPVTFK